ncbi:pyridoxal phosphate-dependent aminotransferase [Silvibacterium dinghuense]|uniref:Aminotransferase n=1 Tax=Silvibacterium dinghuense TaxID=1560006 RepID=A0A4Q1SI68_9BACT|nr:pyridoxal phosphate-dependent aminotransferase [Silvibacterium dinghuense]RXS96890.1 pyridoxal phosphate-dependent aminotransferase [Silvibacterium dinghuense]GGG94460.1 aminotransferase [Silvibacterium dinghuense]
MTASTAGVAREFSERIGRFEVSATAVVVAEAAKLKAAGVDLADFGAGEPHFPTPRHIKDAAIAAIEQNFTHYTTTPGIPEVRKAIVDRHAADFGSDYAPDEAIFTTGGKLAIFYAVSALIDHGDEVIVPVPYWVSYKDIVQYAGGRPVFLETAEADHFRITAEAIESLITPRTRAILLNSPSNPSGAVMDTADFEGIVRLAHERGIYVLLDECYAYLTYKGKPVSGGSYIEAKEHVVVLGSLSKTYAMTGWRAGFALAPKPIIAAMAKLQSQTTSSATHFIQKASIAALSGPQQCVAEMRADYLKLRDEVLAGLRGIPGITCTVPEGAFYVYPNVKAYLGLPGAETAMELASRLLREGHVVTVPGEAFGTREHLRLSYATSHETVAEGVARMKAFFEGLRRKG